MNSQKILILYYFVRLRLSRLIFSGKVNWNYQKYFKHTLRMSPFYSPLVNDGKTFPVIDKQVFMDHFDEMNTVGITKTQAFSVAKESEKSRNFTPTIGNISVGLSSGTSGNKGIFLTSPKEQAIWVGAVLDRVLGWSFRKRRVAFFLRANNNLYESVNSGLIKFSFFDILEPIDSLVPRLLEEKVDILVAQPSVLLEISRNITSNKRKARFMRVISVAEVLEEDVKQRLEEVFNCHIEQVYQCTEGFLAYTCRHNQLHFNEDWLKIEKKYLDDERVRFHPIITDYLRRSQPIVRYELNDIIHEGDECSCGSRMTVIKRIEGRSDDVFRFEVDGKVKVVFPDFIRRVVIQSSDDVGNYMIKRVSQTCIEIALQVDDPSKLSNVFELVKASLSDFFVSFGILGMKIEQVQWEHDPMTKFKRITNEYQVPI